MGENIEQGISRRELLRRGAVLGGAVVWTTPVVQTLGMGRAFAQTASPEGGKDISYVVVQWDCDGTKYHTKWDGGWQAGRTPDCELKLQGSNPANIPAGFAVSTNGPCATITVPEDKRDCAITIYLKAGSSQSTDDPCQERVLTIPDGTGPYQTTVCTV